jgi:4-carboxymuconolactone decarboxylase
MKMSAAPSERFQRGWERLMEVDAEGGERVIESLRDVAPDLGRYVVEFAFGEIYRRPAPLRILGAV